MANTPTHVRSITVGAVGIVNMTITAPGTATGIGPKAIRIHSITGQFKYNATTAVPIGMFVEIHSELGATNPIFETAARPTISGTKETFSTVHLDFPGGLIYGKGELQDGLGGVLAYNGFVDVLIHDGDHREGITSLNAGLTLTVSYSFE